MADQFENNPNVFQIKENLQGMGDAWADRVFAEWPRMKGFEVSEDEYQEWMKKEGYEV